jgi:lipopolysaccharide biosynthesis regulator YciM
LTLMELQGVFLLFLLLPVAALSGWYLAKRSERQKHSNASQKLNIPPEYLKGLNYVLNEQSDKAIEIFIKMLEVDSDTVETHLALGNLFRQRGEVDRAIRIHQNLIARPSLDPEQRSHALLELGMDYMRSGLLDRAEVLFTDLVESGRFAKNALVELLEIYQQEKDWHNSIAIARRLEQVSRENNGDLVAQFYCELAEESLINGSEKDVKEYLKKALNNDSKCARASILEGRLEQKQGKYKNAIRAYKRVIKQDPECMSYALDPMKECYRRIGKLHDFKAYLQELVAEYDNISPVLQMTGLIDELEGKEEAINYISAEIKKRPTVRGIDKMLEYMISGDTGEMHDKLLTIKDLTVKLLEINSQYRCIQCGFNAVQMHWHCPSCRNWDSIKPVHGVEGE